MRRALLFGLVVLAFAYTAGSGAGIAATDQDADAWTLHHAQAGRDIVFGAITGGYRNNTNLLECDAHAKGTLVLTTKINYCRVTTTTGDFLRAPGLIFPGPLAATAGAGLAKGRTVSVCMGATAHYGGNVYLTENHCFS
jgi:hypothetical protein